MDLMSICYVIGRLEMMAITHLMFLNLHIMFVFLKSCKSEWFGGEIFGSCVAFFVMVVVFHERKLLFPAAYFGFYYCTLVKCFIVQGNTILLDCSLISLHIWG